MNWGKWGACFEKLDYQNMIAHCLTLGINTFDHADIYGNYTTEWEFGNALKEMYLDRNQFKIITKCGINLVGDTRPNYNIKSYDTSFDHIIHSVENSLINLQIDFIDTLLIHRPDYFMDYQQIVEAFQYLAESGKVDSFGVSNFNRNQLDAIIKYVKISSNQIELSVFQPENLINGLVGYMGSKNIEITAWSPVGMKYQKQNPIIDNEKVISLTKKYNTQSIDALLILWLSSHPSHIIPVVGTSNQQRLSNYKALNGTMSREDWYHLLQIVCGNEVP